MDFFEGVHNQIITNEFARIRELAIQTENGEIINFANINITLRDNESSVSEIHIYERILRSGLSEDNDTKRFLFNTIYLSYKKTCDMYKFDFIQDFKKYEELA